MGETGEKIIALACTLLVLFIIILSMTMNKEVTAPAPENSCEHEFVVSSKFNFWIKSYKTVSICQKCGLEV